MKAIFPTRQTVALDSINLIFILALLQAEQMPNSSVLEKQRKSWGEVCTMCAAPQLKIVGVVPRNCFRKAKYGVRSFIFYSING